METTGKQKHVLKFVLHEHTVVNLQKFVNLSTEDRSSASKWLSWLCKAHISITDSALTYPG